MEENEKPKFFRLIDSAISINKDQVIRNLFNIRDYITDDLEIIFNYNVEIMELVVRTLAFVDMEIPFSDEKFVVLNCPEDRQCFISWFVQFFAYLETADPYYQENNYRLFYPSESHYEVFESDWCPVDLNLDILMFGYGELKVEFKS